MPQEAQVPHIKDLPLVVAYIHQFQIPNPHIHSTTLRQNKRNGKKP